MKKKHFVYGGFLVVILILVSGLSFANQKRFGKTYEITITNLTRGQIFSPPIAINHSHHFSLFTLGQPASDQLYPLAEDGDRDPLINYIATQPSVSYALSDGPVMPGDSTTLTIRTQRGVKLISVAGMLVTTNDAFFAVRDLKVPKRGEVSMEVEAYDAGSEANSEDCESIPGPPCVNGGVRDTGDAEGYVHVHAGIHSIMDLDPAMFDWRNPVAKITVRAI